MKRHEDAEIISIKKIAGIFPRSPLQVNRLFEADSEIINCQSGTFNFLVAKTDSIQEEISTGLYKDPYLIGWMAVTVSLSDLAATGADPIGVMLALQLPNNYDEKWMAEFQKGVCEACASYDTFILGGDTNFTDKVCVTSTSIGTVDKPLLRNGIKPGDLLYSTGDLGIGNSYAYSVLLDRKFQSNYKPVARLKESKIIRQFASSCMDTSDGLFPALSVLSFINNLGFRLSCPTQNILCPETSLLHQKTGLPSWIFLAGPHGEYELVYSIPASLKQVFENECATAGWLPVLLGEAIPDNLISFKSEDISITCEPAEIPNLYNHADGDIPRYLQLLLKKHQQWATTNTAFYVNETT